MENKKQHSKFKIVTKFDNHGFFFFSLINIAVRDSHKLNLSKFRIALQLYNTILKQKQQYSKLKLHIFISKILY